MSPILCLVLSHTSYHTFSENIALRSFIDERSTLQKITDKVLSFLRECCWFVRSAYRKCIDYCNPKYDFVDRTKIWRRESEGLYVFIHGLNGAPFIWRTQLDLVEKDPTKEIFAPYVPLKGQGTLEETAGPILSNIENYIREHPDKPICLLGVSNGGRICTWIETHLRETAPTTPIKVSTIAAVHFGTERMNIVKNCHKLTGYRLGNHPAIVEDLSYGSQRACSLLNAVKEPLAQHTIRDFEFFASTEDHVVPHIESSLPLLEHHRACYHIVHGYDHNSIVHEVAQKQIASCQAWMASLMSLN